MSLEQKRISIDVSREVRMETVIQEGSFELKKESLEKKIRDRIEEYNECVFRLNTQIEKFLDSNKRKTTDIGDYGDSWVWSEYHIEENDGGEFIPKEMSMIDVKHDWNVDDKYVDYISHDIELERVELDIDSIGYHSYDWDIDTNDFEEEIISQVIFDIQFRIQNNIELNEVRLRKIKNYKERNLTLPVMEIVEVTDNDLETLRILSLLVNEWGQKTSLYDLQQECK